MDSADGNSIARGTKLRIVLAGGSGHLGTLLARYFCSRQHSVVVLSRRLATGPCPQVLWDGKNCGEWIQELDGADLIINLAGRSVNCRYNEQNRREILESRVESTQAIGEAIRRIAKPPRIWLNSSTATIYRHSLDREMDEISGELGGHESGVPASWNFSIKVATLWESTFFNCETRNTRKIALRSAMVMIPQPGGAFDTLLRMVRLGLGGAAGDGGQFVSWIHGADFIRALEFLIEHEELQGSVNVSAPQPLPNRDFMRALRVAWGAKLGFPASRWMLEIGAVFLPTETELILKSRRVVPRRLLESGFTFQFAKWPAAAEDLVRHWRINRSLRRNGQTRIEPSLPAEIAKV
ncbi:MAG TPA: TIGR01777 family oxidoreductase [Candidatus Acidoferrum sp.]